MLALIKIWKKKFLRCRHKVPFFLAISWLYLKLLFQSEAMFEAIDKKTSFCHHAKTDFPNKGFTLSRVSKVSFWTQ